MSEGAAERAAEDDEFEARLAELTRADPFMAWLDVLFALLVGYEPAVNVGSAASTALSAAGWAIWALFLAELLAKLWLAPARQRLLGDTGFRRSACSFPRCGCCASSGCCGSAARCPPRGCCRAPIARWEAPGGSCAHAWATWLGAITATVTIAVAELAFLFERDQPEPAFLSFGDAVIWACATVLALQGDPVPQSLGARLVMLVGFAFGLVIVASLAGTVGAFLLERRGELEA